MTVCTACGKETFSKMLSAAGFQLKGSGWYATDFKNSGKKPAAKADAAKGEAPKADASKADAAKSDTAKGESKSVDGGSKKDASPPSSGAASS